MFSHSSRKRWLWIGMSGVAFAGCGCSSGSGDSGGMTGGECAGSPILGSWRGTVNGQPDTLTFSANCTGTSVLCQSTFSYPNVIANSGTVLVTVTSSKESPYCLGVGDHACSYSLTDTTLTYDCGGGPLVFTRS